MTASRWLPITRFQSTLPVRGATTASPRSRSWATYFNPRSPCGERRHTQPKHRHLQGISIHAPRAGSDLPYLVQDTQPECHFNPRSPCGERQNQVNTGIRQCRISIHAPRAGSDAVCREWPTGTDISIHAPRAGSDQSWDEVDLALCISIHAPRAGSDYRMQVTRTNPQISIHAPRAGSDVRRAMDTARSAQISIHAPRAGSDRPMDVLQVRKVPDFNPRSPCGERRQNAGRCDQHICNFNPRSPCGERLQDAENDAKGLGISIHAPRAGSDSNILCFCKFKAQYILNQLF